MQSIAALNLKGSYKVNNFRITLCHTVTVVYFISPETKVEPTYEYGNESAKLSCSITTSGSVDYTVEKVTWKKGDKPVSSLGDRFEEEAGTLIIKNPSERKLLYFDNFHFYVFLRSSDLIDI